MLNRVTYKFTLDLRRPTINRLKVVNGDTANTFEITVKDAGAAITLDPDLHKVIAVFQRSDGEIYTQDASTGLSFTAAGVVTIDVRPASFRTGTNTVKLQIYKRESSTDEEYPLLLTTYEQVFTARMEAIPEAGAPNAPSQLPMLEGLIEDAGDAIDACEAAAAAARDAVKRFVYTIPHTDGTWTDAEYSCRSTVTTAELLQIMQTASLCIQIPGGVLSEDQHSLTITLYECSRDYINTIAMRGVEVKLQSPDPVEGYYLTAQFTLDYRDQTATASISAQRTEMPPEDVYVLDFSNGTWDDNTFGASVTLSLTELDKLLNARILMTAIPAETGDDIYILYGATHYYDYDFITLSSIPDSLGNYMYLELQHRGGDIDAMGSIKQLSSLPDYSRNDWGKYLRVNSGTGGLEWASLPVYNGGVS